MKTLEPDGDGPGTILVLDGGDTVVGLTPEQRAQVAEYQALYGDGSLPPQGLIDAARSVGSIRVNGAAIADLTAFNIKMNEVAKTPLCDICNELPSFKTSWTLKRGTINVCKRCHSVPAVRVKKAAGRNDPCPCGSGKKFKKCCLHPKQEPPIVTTVKAKPAQDADQKLAIIREELAKWPLYQEEHYCACQPLTQGAASRGEYWIGYWTKPRLKDNHFRREGTGFDLNIVGNVCYLLSIELDTEHRGQGHGAALYWVAVAIAKRMGCDVVFQTASGTTASGETRMAYLERRGWRPTSKPNVAYKWIGDSAEPEQAPEPA